MTKAHHRLSTDLRRIFAPGAEECARRNRTLVAAALDVVSGFAPLVLGAGVLWMMITLTAGWNAGIF